MSRRAREYQTAHAAKRAFFYGGPEDDDVDHEGGIDITTAPVHGGPMSTTSADDIPQMIEDCENRESRMNDWERGFIASVKERQEQGVSLTRNQVEQLDIVWERVTAKG